MARVPAIHLHRLAAWRLGVLVQLEAGGGLAPVNSAAPIITGTTTEGQTLAASAGVWLNDPTSYTYQWQRDGVAISGATASTYVLVTADVGATITVAVTASNAAGASSPAVSAGVGPVAPLAAPFQSVNADGWTATMASPPTFDPVGAPVQVSVSRAGFGAGGTPATLVDTVTLMKRLRLPYPDQATLTADQVVLSDYIHAGDTIPGVVNNSTRAAPRPICMWLHPDMQRASGTFTARLAVAHMFARQGRPVAAVKFILSDGTNTVEQTVSVMSTISYPVSGRTVPHFSATLSLAGLAANALLTLDAIVYPWVGAAFQASVHGATPPSLSFSTQRVLNDVSYGTAYAYVDATLGNNGTAVVSATAATAAASPYATVAAAAAAISAFNAANYGRANASGGVIRLVAGTHVFSTFASVAVADIPLVIEAADPGAQATTIFQDAGTNITNGCPDRLHFRNITLRRGASGSITFLDSAAGPGSGNMMVFENVAFHDGGFGSYYSGWIYRPGRTWLHECTNNITGSPLGVLSTSNKVVNMTGGTVAPTGITYNAAGVYSLTAIFSDSNIGVGDREVAKGRFIGFSFLARNDTANPVVQATAATGPEGFAMVGCVIEDQDGNTAPAVQLWADNNVQPVQNILVQGCTVTGQRVNALYQDTGTVKVDKSGSVRFCAFNTINTKTDVFGANGNLTGNWPAAFHVGWRANAFRRGSDSSNVPGAGSWVGELAALGEAIGTNAAPLDFAFADDRGATGTGGGDYTPGAGSDLPAIPAGLAPWSHDQLGRPIADDGTAKAGALQAA